MFQSCYWTGMLLSKLRRPARPASQGNPEGGGSPGTRPAARHARRRGRRLLTRHLWQAESRAQVRFQPRTNVGIFFEKGAGIFPALANALALVGEPRAAFLDQPMFRSEVQQVAFFRDSLAIENVELRIA